MPEFRGVVFDDVGVAVEGATVNLYDTNTTSPSRANAATDGSGLWHIGESGTGSNGAASVDFDTRGAYDVKIASGTDVVWLRSRDRYQVNMMQAWQDASATTPAAIFTNADAGASSLVAVFEGDSASPADNDEAYISYKMSDDGGTQEEVARVTWHQYDVNPSADGGFEIEVASAGTLYKVFDAVTATGGGQTVSIGTGLSGTAITLGHSTSEVTVADNLTVVGTLTVGSNAEITEAELEMLDGITAGTVAASKAVVVDANKDISSFRNLTASGTISLGATSFNDNSITNVNDIALDSISADGTDINVAVSDNSATALTIKQGSDAYLIIDTANSSESVSIGTGISGTAITLGHSTSEVTVADNLTVTGDFTVNGTTTTVDTTNTTIKDSLIELNNGVADSSNSNDSGLLIERGSTGNNAIFMWDESATGFTVGTTTSTATSTGNLANFTAAPFTAAAIVGTTIDASTDFTIGDTVITDGVVTDSTGLQLAANLDINGTADISGDVTLSGGADGALQFTNAGENSIKIPDNQASALIIEEANNAYITFVTTNSSEAITVAKATTFSAGIANSGTIAAGTWNGTAIASGYIAADAITGAKIADDAVDSDHIAAGAVDLAHMSSESVDEDNLHISNSGSNGQFLSKQSGNSGGLTWATPSVTATALDDVATGDAASTLATSAGNITIDAQGDNTDIIFKGTDDTSDITMLTLDGSEAGKALFNGDVSVGTSLLTATIDYTDGDLAMTIADGGGVTFAQAVTADAGVAIDNITIDGTEIDLSSGDLTLDVAGDIILDAAGANVLPGGDNNTDLGATATRWQNVYAQKYHMDASVDGIANENYSGMSATIRVGDGANVGAFDLVCISDVTNEVQIADADAIATARVIGINPLNATISDNSEGIILLHGFVRNDAWGWTTGQTLYLSTTAGDITATAPSGEDDCVVPIGIALEPDMIYFNPSQTIIEHTG